MKRIYQYYLNLKKRRHTVAAKLPFSIRLLLPLIGLLALVWFLVRVIPKPGRAAYPCQRLAFPLASGFILWIVGIFGALKAIQKAQRLFAYNKKLTGLCCVLLAGLLVWITMTATSPKQALAADPIPNNPIGIAKGIFPGRVVWVHDPNATSWIEGNGHPWEPDNTSQSHVDAMVAKSIRQISGAATDSQAWDAIFRYFNTAHDKGDIGYTPGEKITIKVNLTTTNNGSNMNLSTYEKTGYLDKSDTSPIMILSVIRQLVIKAGVDPADIAVGDTLCHYPNQWRDLIISEFPTVVFFDMRGEQGRTLSVPSTVRQYWSSNPSPDKDDYIPQLYAEADYLINMAVLKGHGAGITLCAKNHYGSYNRRPDNADFYSLHDSLGGGGFDSESGKYRALVDIMGHPHMGAKTLLYMVDGLYGGYYWRGTAYKFDTAPFNGDWPSSIFVSLDPVAIDSVGYDILWHEWPHVVQFGGVDDYLIEAALADNPPSGTIYDPDGDGTPLQSLGVHERWNNPTDRQYTGNLGTGDGIELVYIKMPATKAGDINSDTRVDVFDLMQVIDLWLWVGAPAQILEDIAGDGTVNMHDFSILSENWD